MTDPASPEKKDASKQVAAAEIPADNKDQIARIRAACVENAEALLNAATTIAFQAGSNNIAYHLAALALEEIGKSSMIFMSSLRAPGDEERKRLVDWIEDHERKLFWAIWSMRSFDGKNPTKDIQQAFGIAKHIHETRLATLYVDPADPDARKSISDEDVQNLLKLTEAQIGLEKLKKPRDLSAEEKADLDWFFAAADDPYLKTIVFSKGSFEKQAEFGDDSLGWMRWLKGIVEENNRANVELANKELGRQAAEGDEGYEDKYEISIRLRSWSHAVKRKALTDWNDHVDKIRFYKGSGNHELLIKFILPKRITVQEVWPAGMHNALMLVTAINIGTAGFFWWYLPEFVSSFAENIVDLEAKAKMGLTRVPELKVMWGNQNLTSETLNKVSVVFAHLAHSIKDEARVAVYQRYWRALALLAKNDIFFQFEGNLLIEFHLVLKEALAAYGDWDGKEEMYDAAVDAAFQRLNIGTDFTTTLHDLIGVAEMTMRGENKTRPVSLEDVVKLKVACDFYLLLKAGTHMQQEIEAMKAADAAKESSEELSGSVEHKDEAK